jgi:hypothetical protein
MKATILSHTALPAGNNEIHRFSFELDDGSNNAPIHESISLRTLRVIVSHLEDGNAFIAMLREIAKAHQRDYGKLVGMEFRDSFREDGPSDRSPEIILGWKNARK